MVKQIFSRTFLLGFDTFSGTVTALAEKKETDTYDLKPAIENSYAGYCHKICEKKKCGAFFLNLTREDYPREISEFLSRRMYHRYVGINYCPESEMRSHYSLASLAGQYHGFIFIDKTSFLRILSPAELEPPKPAGTPAQGGARGGINFFKQGHRRLVQEYKQIARRPIPEIRVSPQEDNLWICHFVMDFKFGDYEGGEYHGRLELPPDYPMAPPKIFFMTPSGRFETETKICVSFSDYHPELWNPSWGIESVLVGLQSFMQEDSPGSLGSIVRSRQHRRDLARKSHEFNLKDPHYVELFEKNQGISISHPAEYVNILWMRERVEEEGVEEEGRGGRGRKRVEEEGRKKEEEGERWRKRKWKRKREEGGEG
jgi:ubiquitin-protein ligase